VSEISSALIVGTGLIGTSVALALRGDGVVVHLTDRDPKAVRRAADLGAGDPSLPAEQVDLAVVAVAPSATAAVVSGLLAGNVAATVVDTAGVKADILRDVRATVGDAVHFVGTHPMAAVPILPKKQPASRLRYAGHRPIASRGILQIVHHLPIRVEGESPGHASELLLAKLHRHPLHHFAQPGHPARASSAELRGPSSATQNTPTPL